MNWLRFLKSPHRVEPVRPEGQRCRECGYFDYCDPEDVDGSDGYCGLGISRGEQYGNWQNSNGWCKYWLACDAPTPTRTTP